MSEIQRESKSVKTKKTFSKKILKSQFNGQAVETKESFVFKGLDSANKQQSESVKNIQSSSVKASKLELDTKKIYLSFWPAGNRRLSKRCPYFRWQRGQFGRNVSSWFAGSARFHFNNKAL